MSKQVRPVGEVTGEVLGHECERFELPMDGDKQNVVFVLRIPDQHIEFVEELSQSFSKQILSLSTENVKCHAMTMSDAYTLDVLAVEEEEFENIDVVW